MDLDDETTFLTLAKGVCTSSCIRTARDGAWARGARESGGQWDGLTGPTGDCTVHDVAGTDSHRSGMGDLGRKLVWTARARILG